MNILVLLLMTTAAFANDPLPTMTVWSKRSYDYLRAKYPNQRIEYMDQSSNEKDMAEEGYLSPHVRDALFDRLKLTKLLQPVDQVGKDMLVMSVRDADSKQLARLHESYPMLSIAQLHKLKAEVRRAK